MVAIRISGLVMLIGFWFGGIAHAQDAPDLERVKWERQIVYIQTLLAREPSLPQHYMRMAQAYAQLGSTDNVLRYTQEAVRLGGNPLAADILVADHLEAQGRHEEAMASYMRVLDSSPRQAHTLNRIWLIIQSARGASRRAPAGAADALTRLNNAGYFIAPEGTPLNDAASRERIQTGNQRLNNGDVAGAINDYKDAARQDPWNPDAYRGMGIAYARTGDVDRAVGAYNLYIALAPPGTSDVPKVRQIIMDFYLRAQ